MADSALVSDEKRDERGRFIIPPKSPGRPPSSRNALGEDFIRALAEDFKANGKQAVEKVRDENPAAYLKVIAQIVPKEVHHRVEDFAELSEDEIETRLIELLAAAGHAGRGGKAGAGARHEARAKRGPGPLPN